jgi:hypothetical protein
VGDDNTALTLPSSTTPDAVTKELMVATCNYQVAKYPSAAIALAITSFEVESRYRHEASKWTAIIGQLQSVSKVETSDLMKCRDEISKVLPSSNEISTALNSTYLVRIIPKLDTITPTKELTSGISGAVKRKATSEKCLSISENSKKIHALPRTHPYSTEATSRHVAGSCAGETVAGVVRRRYRTYAEILKSGIEDKSLKKADSTPTAGFSEMITTPPLIQLQQS